MGSKRKGGVCDLPSTSEEDEGSDRKKRPAVWKTCRIYSTEYVTSSNRDEKKMASAKIGLNVNTTEREIREILIRELPQLRGNRFTFFTKDGAGKWYFCPCSLKCEGKDHLAEWNGRNIPRAAKSNRAVYILIESTTMEQTRSRGVENDTPTNPVPTGPQFRSTVGQHSSNPWDQKQVRVVVKNHQGVSCPDLSLSGLKHQENTSVQPLSAKHGNDLNQWPTQLIHLSKETEYGKVKDGGRVTEEKDGEGEGRIDVGDEKMQTDTWNSNLASTRGYDTFSSESSTYVPPEDLSLPMPDEELQPYLYSVLRSPNPTLLMETVNGESTRNPLAIEEIVPIKGNIKGGDSFVLCFAEPCVVDYCQVRFGIADPVPVIRRGNDYRGNIPPYHTPGEVEVQLVSRLGDPISDTVTFTYTDESAMKKWAIKPQDIRNMDADDLPLALLEIAHRMGQMRLQPKENANRTEDANAEAMLLLRIIAGTAAKINAIDFFRIVFSTNVGHSVFKCFKDEQPLLEDIARGNGHDELASFLKEKHLMYRDDESDSYEEVDWEELVKAIEQYQTLNGENNEKKTIRSAMSSESMYGYLGDGESSTTLSSSEISVAESFPKDTLEDQDQAPLESKCPEERSSRYASSERLVLTGALKSSEHPEAAETGYYGTKCEEFLLFTCIWNLNLVWLKRKEISVCFILVAILLALLSFLLIFTGIFFSWPGPFRATRALATTVTLTARPACANGLSTIHCEECGASLRNVNTVDTAQWKIKYPNTGWIKFSRCIKFNTSCVVTRPMLPEGIKVLKASIDTVTLQRRVENNTDGYARLMFEVNYMPIPVIMHVYEVNFTRRCVWIQEGNNVNLSRISSNMLPCEHVIDIEWYHANKSMFAYCSSCQVCKKTSNVNHPMPVFWNRLRVKRGSLSLIAFEKNDDGLTIEMKVRMKASPMWPETTMESVRVYTLWMFVNSSIKTGGPPATITASKLQKCFDNGLLTLDCSELVRRRKAEDLEWRIKVPSNTWTTFGYCSFFESRSRCIALRSMMPEEIKILRISNDSVTLEKLAEDDTNHHFQVNCRVHHHSVAAVRFYDVNFSTKSVLIQEGRDVNLTRYFLDLMRCEHVAEMDWYSDRGCKLAHCNSCHDCKETSDANHQVPDFRDRLHYTTGSVFLTKIQGSDDGLKIRIRVRMKASRKSTVVTESLHVNTILIFVNRSVDTGSPVPLAQTAYFCQDDKITIWDPVTRSVQCHDCLKQCPAGQGLSVRCGEVIITKTPVGCKQCVLGKTYSSAYDVGACKDCKNCGPYRKTIKACTLTSKAVCGSCKIGTYLEPVLAMCFPCSPCCNDGKDIFVPECQVPEVPTNMRCSILRSTKCISAVVPSSVAIKPPPPQENNTNSKTKLISLNTYRHPQPLWILMFEITLFASNVLLLMSLVALVLRRGFRKYHANSNCYTPLFKHECTPICIVGSDQSCDFEMDPCISCLEKLKLIPEEIKINALPFKVEMMLMEKLDTKGPGQDWLDLGAKLGICVSGLGIVALEEKRGRSPTRCLFQILSSLENVVSLRTVVAATHMLGRHDICNATYEVCKSQGFIT